MLEKLLKWANARKNDEGVTLIELLAVIVILAIIAAIAIPVVLGSITSAKVSTTEQNLTVISEALNRYAADPSGGNGAFPVSTTWEKVSSISVLSNYLQTAPKDAWGGDFYYESDGTGKNFVVATSASASQTGAPAGDGTYYMSNALSSADDGTAVLP